MGSFSCSIPHFFVLSHNIPMINTTSNLASFWRFSLTASFVSSTSLTTGHYSLATDHNSLTPRPTPHAPRRRPPQPAGSVCEETPRWLLPDTNRRLVKERTGSDLDERPVYFSMSPNRSIAAEKSICFFPTRCRTTVDHSHVAGGAGRQCGMSTHFPAPRKRGLLRLPEEARTGASQGLLAPGVVSGKMYT